MPHIDVVIDDGGHLAQQQIVTLEEMLPHMRRGGVYICEDIATPHNRFAAYVQGLSNNLNVAAWRSLEDPKRGMACEPSMFQRAIQSIHLYPFITVIEKTDEPLRELLAIKHGTEWQPFL